MSVATKVFSQLKTEVREYLKSLGAKCVALPWQTYEGYLVMALPTRFNEVNVTVMMMGDNVVQDFIDIDIFCRLDKPRLVPKFDNINYNPVSGKYNMPIPYDASNVATLLSIFKNHLSLII
jgi:hypothetical protein